MAFTTLPPFGHHGLGYPLVQRARPPPNMLASPPSTILPLLLPICGCRCLTVPGLDILLQIAGIDRDLDIEDPNLPIELSNKITLVVPGRLPRI